MITRCPHGHVCLVNAGRALHPVLLDVCEEDAMGRRGKADPIGTADDTVLTGHRMIRDGSVWRCLHNCGATLPFPAGLIVPETPCVPRRWGDQPITGGGR